MRSAPTVLVVAVLSACIIALAFSAGMLAASPRTIGPATTASGKACYVTSTFTATPKLGVVPSFTYSGSWTCSPGSNGWTLRDGSRVSNDICEADDPVFADWCSPGSGESCWFEDECSASGTYTPTPPYGAYYNVTKAVMYTRWTLNGDLSDDDWWTSWPSECQAFRTNSQPVENPDLLRCSVRSS